MVPDPMAFRGSIDRALSEGFPEYSVVLLSHPQSSIALLETRVIDLYWLDRARSGGAKHAAGCVANMNVVATTAAAAAVENLIVKLVRSSILLVYYCVMIGGSYR